MSLISDLLSLTYKNFRAAYEGPLSVTEWLKLVALAELQASIGGGGNVSAASNIQDTAITIGDGGVKGIKTSGVLIDSSGNIINLASGSFGFTGRSKFISTADGLISLRNNADTLPANLIAGLIQVTKYSAAGYTIGTTDPSEAYGGIITAIAALTFVLPAVVNGMSCFIKTEGAVAVSVDPNASDKIYLDGVALDDGDKITNLSTAGDTAFLHSRNDGTGWDAVTNGWTDGG